MSIPLYFIKEEQAKEFMQIVLDVFEETISEDDDTIPALTQSLYLKNFPNPFNPSTTIQFTLPKEDMVEVVIYNIRGQAVRSFDKERFIAGTNTIVWDGTDGFDRVLSSGIYLYRVRTDSGLDESKKMLLMK
jgi:hypothetical protein